MKLFSRRLTNDSIAKLDKIVEAVSLVGDVNDVFAAVHSAGLSKFYDQKGMKERFGSRVKKDQLLSHIFGIINGMANRIEEMERKIKSLENGK